MPRIAEQAGPVTGGVDTHADVHVAAVADRVCRVLGTRAFPADPAGYRAALAWMRAHGELVKVGVEGTGSYGAGLARYLAACGIEVAEVIRPNRQARRRRGKSDTAAAALIGFAALHASTEAHLGRYGSMSAAAAARMQQIVPAGACVLTDQVSFLVMANRFNFSSPGCSSMIDGLGTDLALSGGLKPSTGAGKIPAVTAIWRDVLTHAQYLWLTTRAHRRIPWTPSLRAYVRDHFVQVMKDSRGDALYARRGMPGSH